MKKSWPEMIPGGAKAMKKITRADRLPKSAYQRRSSFMCTALNTNCTPIVDLSAFADHLGANPPLPLIFPYPLHQNTSDRYSP